MAPAKKTAAPKPTPAKTPTKQAAPLKTPAHLAPPRFTPAAKLPPLATLTSWSYSVYTAYLKCPLSVCFDKIKRIRIVEPPNPHFEKGDRVHKSAEAHITAPGRKAPPIIPELKGAADRLNLFRKMKAMAELEWAFNRDWRPTSWFGQDAWLRIKVDVCAEQADPPLVHITDWKTGKVYEEHKQQRSLYALGGLQMTELGLLLDGAKDAKVLAEHVYTDTGFAATEEFAMKDLGRLKREWTSRIKTMMSDTRYPAKVGFHCRYCRYRKSNGGPCPEAQ